MMPDDHAYIAHRVIDCCLREDLHGLASRGRAAQPPAAVQQAWPGKAPELWWQVAHLPAGILWLPVHRCNYMQEISAAGDGWILETNGQMQYQHGTEAWLDLLARDLDPETQSLHHSYAEEARCAAQHRALARQAYAARTAELAQALDHPDTAERALRCDQIASYRDHPYYPTARAKSGFDEDALRRYAPEFDPVFELRWLAVPSASLTLTSPPPAFWPQLHELGLPTALEASHTALPVHPLTWEQLDAFPLPPGVQRAPLPHLHVRPTLSVRTLMVVKHPKWHLKLPLTMRTLGALNLRLIKPSTLYDGHWFQRVLSTIASTDSTLSERYLHVDESHGGHVDEAKHLAYLVRAYPPLAGQTLVPAAALCAAMPDGRPLAQHLADRFHDGDLLDWWRAYADLLCVTHLRLWLVYGIALEANQQNTVLSYASNRAPQLLMKDNDAARVLLLRLYGKLPSLAGSDALRDPRISVESDDALARMFCTIILQLDLLAVLEGLAEYQSQCREPMYAQLRASLFDPLVGLAAEGIDTSPAEALLGAAKLPVKYLLSAGSLLGKQATGAADINKFYGDSAPNPFAATFAARGATVAKPAA